MVSAEILDLMKNRDTFLYDLKNNRDAGPEQSLVLLKIVLSLSNLQSLSLLISLFT